MSRVCQVTGRKTRVGNKVCRRGLAKHRGGVGLKTTGITRRRFKPNLQSKKIWVPELNRFVRVRVCASVMKTVALKGAYRVLLDAGLVKPPKPRTKIPAP
ncbi:MAG: 50S ribosomal protein L28 [Planctomycetota bacterium]